MSERSLTMWKCCMLKTIPTDEFIFMKMWLSFNFPFLFVTMLFMMHKLAVLTQTFSCIPLPTYFINYNICWTIILRVAPEKSSLENYKSWIIKTETLCTLFNLIYFFMLKKIVSISKQKARINKCILVISVTIINPTF